MARERQDTVIDGHRYEMTMLAATPSYKLFTKLLKMFGPSIGTIIDVTSKSGDGVEGIDLNSQAVVKGIRALMDHVGEDDIEHVIERLKKQTHVSVEKGSEKTIPLSGVFELHFQGDIWAMFKWLWWGLQVQYSNFSDAFANLKTPSEGEAFKLESVRTP